MKPLTDFGAGSWVYRAVAVCCVCLIALTGFVSAAHIHSDSSGAPEHSCSVCALAHVGVATTQVGAALPLLLQSLAAHSFSQEPHALFLVSSQFIRPPPLG